MAIVQQLARQTVRLEGLGDIGHVANSVHTVVGESISAGRPYDRIGKKAYAKVMYEIHARVMHNDGYIFYLSVNGVWLTKVVPTKYMRKL